MLEKHGLKDFGLGVYDLTPREFRNYLEGEKLREELVLDKLRVIVANMFNSSGHTKKALNPQDVFKLSIDDVVKKKVKSRPTVQQLLEWANGKQS